jgi:Na+/citrate or Na+/malate symporter
MSVQQSFLRILRSIGAVLAGIVVGVALTLGTDAILHATAVFPLQGQRTSDPLLLLATLYRTLYGVASAYITARLAPSRPMAHALAGGVIGLIVSTIGAVATWNRGPEFGPHWYPVALIVLALPTAWAGAKLRQLFATT